MENFGARLKSLRKAAGMTQQELADGLGVHLQTVSKWERDVSKPDFSLLGEIAAALRVSLERLLGLPEEGELFTGSFDTVQEGRAIASLRRAKGESQDETAAAAGVSSGTVSKWERGVTCPDMSQLGALSLHFGVPASRLYYGISADVATETPAQSRRRRRGGLIAVLAAIFACTAAIVLAVVLPDALKLRFTVTVDGREYKVASGDWFVAEKPERDGYIFEYFEDVKGREVDFPVRITASTEYRSVFSPREYTIDYWLNGGAFSAEPAYGFDIESGVVSLPVPEKSGAEFLGWYLAPDFSGTAVDGVECRCADIDLYAKWSDGVYTVRYELNGGALDKNNPAQVTRESAEELAEPVRGGYVFLGWFDAPEGGSRYTHVGGADARNVTLYARWQASGNCFSVTYDACGGRPLGDNPALVGAGEVHTLFGAQKDFYDFLGWNTAADGSGEWVERLYGVNGDLELYAVYSPKVYVVIYDLDGGTYADECNPNEITYGERVTLEPLLRAGHEFCGWYTQKTGGERITEINADNVTALTTVYARFTANVYTITLDAAGGSFRLDGGEYGRLEYDMTFNDVLDLPECTLAGYDFLGWYDRSGGRVVTVDAENMGDIVLTAKYREAGLAYNVNYVPCGGKITGYAPAKVAWGQQVPLPSAERDGWLFLGWNTAADGSGEYLEVTPAGRQTDLTLYAVWQEIMVSGSAEDFSYKVGQESAVVTGYTGAFGQNVDLVIPAYIKGKPVVAVEGRIGGYSDGHPEALYLNSLVIPDTVKRLGENCFGNLCIAQSVVIPAGVEEIGAYCFDLTDMSLAFESGALKSIGENAFSGSYIRNVPVLPEGLERLESGAFFGATILKGGVVLPASLKYIGGYALAFECESSNVKAAIYLPEGVEEIEPFAFGEGAYGNSFGRVYTSLTVSEREKFADGWDSGAEIVYVEDKAEGITLKYGGSERYVSGSHFALPELYKEGCTFIGWRDAQGDFVSFNYIPLRGGVVLEAVFEERSPADGRSSGTPFVLEDGREYELIVFGDEPFWVVPDAEAGARVRITFGYEKISGPGDERPELYREGKEDLYLPCAGGVSFTYDGELLRFEAGLLRREFFRVTVRADIA